MKKLYTLLFVMLFIANVNAQSLAPKVIASAGGFFTSANASLSWTMGETITQTFSSGSVTLTQGFQQPTVNLSLLNLKAYFEGYYSGAGLMDNLGGGGCLYINSISPNPLDVDTVFVSAMDPVTYTVVDTKSGIIKTDGTVSIAFGNAVASGSSYYIRVIHRNALETWSANPVLMSSNTSYDFTTAASQAYGSNMIQTYDNVGWAFYSGDISDSYNLGLGYGYQDGIMESQDYLDMENYVSFVTIGYVPAEITGDGVVEAADYIIMENNVSSLRFSSHP